MKAALAQLMDGWRAELALGFAHDGARTVIARKRHLGPLIVQRPFYPEGEVCHVYLVHPPGGIVGGDRLRLDAELEPGTHVVMTTPAATKFYRSLPDRYATLDQRVVVRTANLEWLPQETILFRDTNARTMTRIDLEKQSRFIGWELTCYGRPAGGERFDRGRARQHLEVWIDGQPAFLDRLHWDGSAQCLHSSWGLSGHTLLGTLLAYPATQPDLETARDHEGFACTLADGVLSCRFVHDDADSTKRAFLKLWCALRPRIFGLQAVPPRIWST